MLLRSRLWPYPRPREALHVDPTLPDTDGGGLSDATEIGPKASLTLLGRTFTWNSVFSATRLADTDGDRLSDLEERNRGTNR